MLQPDMESFKAQVVSTLTKLSPEELRRFGIYLRNVGEEPRVSRHDLEMATKPEELADLLLKRYVMTETPRVLVQVLGQVPRKDLALEWGKGAARHGLASGRMGVGRGRG